MSVSVEVYEYLTQADHKAENLAHEQRRHWDGRECDEYIISTEGRWMGFSRGFAKMYVVKGKVHHLAKYNIAAAHLWQKWHKQL